MDRGDNLATPGGELVEDRDVEVAVDGHRQCPGDRGGSHHEDVRCLAPGDQSGALGDTELVLFVDDDEAEVVEDVVAEEEGMGADEDLWGGVVLVEQRHRAVLLAG